MKLNMSYKLFFFFLTLLNLLNKINSLESKSESSLQNHYAMMAQFKATTKSLLNNFYSVANSAYTSSEERAKKILKRKLKNSKKLKRKLLRSKSQTHSSTYHSAGPVEYTQYKYIEYFELIQRIKNLATQYPDYVKIETAQKLYNLPNPGGFCGENKEKYFLIKYFFIFY